MPFKTLAITFEHLRQPSITFDEKSIEGRRIHRMLLKVVKSDSKVIIKGRRGGYRMCFLDLLRVPLLKHSWCLNNVIKSPPPTVSGNLIESQHTRCTFDIFTTDNFSNVRLSGTQLQLNFARACFEFVSQTLGISFTLDIRVYVLDLLVHRYNIIKDYLLDHSISCRDIVLFCIKS